MVTVLFADAVGHTSISETLGEEAAYELIQGCFKRMQDAVQLYDGTVNQFTGDGILALFGAPIAYEDSARRAVAAALEMQRSLGEYAAEVQSRHPIQCAYRIGLNTGPVVVGKISDELDLEFAAIGDTVNLASRMESMAEPGSVYLTENTYRAVQDYFECASLGKLAVKGKKQPVATYRALREKSIQGRFDAATERGLTPYVGRDQELSILKNYLEQAKQNRGQIVLISGDAGMGKSRLLLEFKKSIPQDDATWLEGHCIAYGHTTPYLPFVEIVKRVFDVKEGDDEATIVRKAGETTADWTSGSRDAVPYLRYLLDVDPGDEAVANMDPMERRAGIFESLRTLLLEACKRRPLVVVVEDLHWIDEKSEEALASLVDALASIPVVLVLTSRPGYKHGLGERSYFSRLALGNLRAEEGAAMLARVLDSDALPPRLLELIESKAEGNPFYIEEVAKSLMESGVLVRRDGELTLDRSLDRIHIPDTVQEVILSRIDRLDRESKSAIQLASVIGREFTVRLLDRIADVEGQLNQVLKELRNLELIYETGYSSELSYMFKHALTHDVAYSTLLIERRKALHRIVAMAIEELYTDRLPDQYEALAHHYEAGETWDKALDYLEKAGDKAVKAYSNQAAIDFFGRALNACDRTGDEVGDRFCVIAEKRAWVYFGIADYVAAEENTDRIIDIATALNNQELEARALAMRGFFEYFHHDFEIAEISLLGALKLGAALGLEDVQYMARTSLYNFYLVTNDHGKARQQEESIKKFPKAHRDPLTVSHWLFFAALDENWKGRYPAAAKHASEWRELPPETPQIMVLHVRWSEALVKAGAGNYREAIELLHGIATECERMGEIAVRARALNTLGWIHGDLQDHAQSIEYNHRGVEVALLEGDEPEKLCNARLNWADALINLGRYDEAETIFAEMENTIRNPKPQDRWMLWRYSQHFFHSSGELCLAREDYDGAFSLANECLQLAEHSSSLKYVVKARRLRAQAQLAQRDFGGATQDLETAIRLAKDLGNPPQLWKSYAAMGKLMNAQNKNTEATQAFRHAVTVLDTVAHSLPDEALRKTFLASDEVRSICEKA